MFVFLLVCLFLDVQRKLTKCTVGPIETPNWHMEIVASVLVTVYVLNFLIGRSKNDKIAKAWYVSLDSPPPSTSCLKQVFLLLRRMDTLKPVFSRQFAVLGAYEGEEQGGLLKDSQSCFKFYAS